MAKAGFFTHVLAVLACLGVLVLLETVLMGQMPLFAGLCLLVVAGATAAALLTHCVGHRGKKKAARRRASVRVLPSAVHHLPPAA